MSGRAIDLTGQVFGRWFVIGRGQRAGVVQACWLCRCECGAEKVVLGQSLREKKSSGCRQCVVPRTISAGQRYGTRVVVEVLSRGRVAWRCDCGRSGTTTDNNVRRAGCAACAHGSRIHANGESHNMSHWARTLGISRQALFLRIQNGWPVDVAVTTPKIQGRI